MAAPKEKETPVVEKTPWIKAYRSQVNLLETYPENIKLIDTETNGDNKLVIAEFKKRLAFYKGTQIDWETKLPSQPSSMCHFTIEIDKNSINFSFYKY